MSSLLANLKNKVTYNLHQAVNDPDANEFAANQPESPPPATEKVENDDYFEISTTDDPNTFNANRLFRKIGNQIIRMIKKGFFPVIALILSMYVTNELIVYSAPIRLIFFIFTFLICYHFMPFLILLLGYYLCKSGYQYYLNNLSDGPKTKIMPTIFALLPLTTDMPVSSLGSFFMYPFTYPKNDKDAKKLPIIMNNYMESLKKAFTYFDKIKGLPFVAEGFKKLEASMEHLHDIAVKPEPVSSSTSSSTSSTSLPDTIKKSQNQPVPSSNNKGNAASAAASTIPVPAIVEKSQNQPEPSANNKGNVAEAAASSTTLPATVEKTQNQPKPSVNNKGNASEAVASSTTLPATINLAKQPITSPASNK